MRSFREESEVPQPPQGWKVYSSRKPCCGGREKQKLERSLPPLGALSATAVLWAPDSRVHPRRKPTASEGHPGPPPGLGWMAGVAVVLWATRARQAGRRRGPFNSNQSSRITPEAQGLLSNLIFLTVKQMCVILGLVANSSQTWGWFKLCGHAVLSWSVPCLGLERSTLAPEMSPDPGPPLLPSGVGPRLGPAPPRPTSVWMWLGMLIPAPTILSSGLDPSASGCPLLLESLQHSCPAVVLANESTRSRPHPLHLCPITRFSGCWLIPASWTWPGDLCDLSRSWGVNWKPSFRQAKQSWPSTWETVPSRPSSQPLRAVSPLLGARHLLQLCPVAGVQALLHLSAELCWRRDIASGTGGEDSRGVKSLMRGFGAEVHTQQPGIWSLTGHPPQGNLSSCIWAG